MRQDAEKCLTRIVMDEIVKRKSASASCLHCCCGLKIHWVNLHSGWILCCDERIWFDTVDAKERSQTSDESWTL